MISKKKGLQASHADFSESFRWTPSRAHAPAEANGLPEAHGPPRGLPKVIVPPAPLSAALDNAVVSGAGGPRFKSRAGQSVQSVTNG